MSFFKNYSQNGAAQALVVLGAFTVVAELVRARSGKRPYRDYGVGGMNEAGSRMMFPPPHWRDAAGSDLGPVEHDAYDDMMDTGEGVHHEVGFAGRQAPAGQRREGNLDYMMARAELPMLMNSMAPEMTRLMEEGMTEEEAMEHVLRAAGQGSMSRGSSPWNDYVATEVPRLMKGGMSAPQAMKEAARTFHRSPGTTDRPVSPQMKSRADAAVSRRLAKPAMEARADARRLAKIFRDS